MSFDIYLMTLVVDEAGEQLRFSRSIVEEAFRSIAVELDTDAWTIQFPGCEFWYQSIFVDTEPKITGFSVNSPPDLTEFWDAMYKVLRRTPAVVVWPGPNPSYCVAQVDYASLVPTDYMEGFGPPVVVNNGDELLAAVKASVG